MLNFDDKTTNFKEKKTSKDIFVQNCLKYEKKTVVLGLKKKKRIF